MALTSQVKTIIWSLVAGISIPSLHFLYQAIPTAAPEAFLFWILIWPLVMVLLFVFAVIFVVRDWTPSIKMGSVIKGGAFFGCLFFIAYPVFCILYISNDAGASVPFVLSSGVVSAVFCGLWMVLFFLCVQRLLLKSKQSLAGVSKLLMLLPIGAGLLFTAAPIVQLVIEYCLFPSVGTRGALVNPASTKYLAFTELFYYIKLSLHWLLAVSCVWFCYLAKKKCLSKEPQIQNSSEL